jgi:hypothetical protein
MGLINDILNSLKPASEAENRGDNVPIPEPETDQERFEAVAGEKPVVIKVPLVKW